MLNLALQGSFGTVVAGHAKNSLRKVAIKKVRIMDENVGAAKQVRLPKISPKLPMFTCRTAIVLASTNDNTCESHEKQLHMA